MPTEQGEIEKPRRRGRPPGPVQKLTISEVAEMHGFPVPTVYGWTRQLCRDNKPVLPVQKFGRLVRVLRSDAEAVPTRLNLRRPRALPSFFSNSAKSGGDE